MELCVCVCELGVGGFVPGSQARPVTFEIRTRNKITLSIDGKRLRMRPFILFGGITMAAEPQRLRIMAIRPSTIGADDSPSERWKRPEGAIAEILARLSVAALGFKL